MSAITTQNRRWKLSTTANNRTGKRVEIITTNMRGNDPYEVRTRFLYRLVECGFRGISKIIFEPL